MTKEIWKSVPNYDNYMVSSRGRVKSMKFGKERMMKQSLNIYGYFHVCLSKEGKSKTITVHKVVAIAFLNHTPCGHKLVVDHRNNDKTNNNLNNLQLVSQRENTSKDKKGGSSKYVGVWWYKALNKWHARIRINGKQKHLGYFTDEVEAHNAYQNALKEI
tara:strand:+ start:11 stop:490 length:480 start_codon:yes stop_codon:yes gene_type:complete